MDVLLVHAPKFHNFYNPIGHFVLGNTIPVGLFAIAGHLEREGVRARILHSGMERIENPSFTLGDYVAEKKPGMVGFSLHWHYQAWDVLDAAGALKRRFPDLPILLGGFTASFFADEILRGHPEVDFIIRGEGEAPCVMLASRLRGHLPLDDVPNLSWRSNGEIRHNPISFVADDAFLSGLEFHRYDLLKNADRYRTTYSQVLWSRSFPRFLNRRMFPPYHVVCAGRGCPVQCSYCAGGKDSLAAFTGRDGVSLRSVDSVLGEIREVARLGVRSVYFVHDPYPRSDYYPEIFRRMKSEGFRFRILFDCFGLPTEEFIGAFSEAAAPGSFITIGVETGDEDLRARNRGYFYTDAEILACLDAMERRGVRFYLCYTLGLPGETGASLKKTKAFWDSVARRYRCLVEQNATLIHPDPGSPMERDPAGHGIALSRASLADCIETHRVSHRKSYSGWGHLPVLHECPGVVKDMGSRGPRATGRALQRFKCRYLCPFKSKMGIFYPLNRWICLAAGAAFRLDRILRGLSRG